MKRFFTLLFSVSVLFCQGQYLFSGTNEDLDSVIVNLADVPVLLSEGSNTIVYRSPTNKQTLAQTVATVIAATGDNFFSVTSFKAQRTYRAGQVVGINKSLIETIIKLDTTCYIKMKNSNVSLEVDEGYTAIIALATEHYYNNSTYTPTIDSTINLDSARIVTGSFNYTRLGSYVDVWGTMTIDATADSTAAEAQLTFPVTSNITGAVDVIGMGYSSTTSGNSFLGVGITGDAARDRARVLLRPMSEAIATYQIHFRYRIR